MTDAHFGAACTCAWACNRNGATSFNLPLHLNACVGGGERNADEKAGLDFKDLHSAGLDEPHQHC